MPPWPLTHVPPVVQGAGGGGAVLDGRPRGHGRRLRQHLPARRVPGRVEAHGQGVPAMGRRHQPAERNTHRRHPLALDDDVGLVVSQKQGQTPLHYCLAYKYDDLASYLISKGADDTVVNNFGLTCYEGLKPEDTQDEK